jgi:hypothetical protein
VFGQGGGGGRFQQIIAIFREKGATSPDKAMTIQELGLPPRFEQAMHRRLGATGVFVDAGNGRYYLDETKLQQLREQRMSGNRGAGGPWGGPGYGGQPGQEERWHARRNMMTFRIARMAVGVTAILLLIANILYFQSLTLRYVWIGLAVLWVVLTVFQIYYLSRMRSGFGGRQTNSMQ